MNLSKIDESALFEEQQQKWLSKKQQKNGESFLMFESNERDKESINNHGQVVHVFLNKRKWGKRKNWETFNQVHVE